MPLIAESTGTCSHTGSILGGSVGGTLQVTTQNFVTVEGSPIMVDKDFMIVPTHPYSLLPPYVHSHQYHATPTQVFVYVENDLVNQLGDAYATDETVIDSAGALNTFVFIEQGQPIPPIELWPAPYDTPSYIPWLYYW